MKYKYFPPSIFSLFVLKLIFCKSASKAHLTTYRVLHNRKEYHRAEKYVSDVIKATLEEGPLKVTNSSIRFPDIGGDEVKYIEKIDSWLKKEFDNDDYPDNQVIILTKFHINENRIYVYTS